MNRIESIADMTPRRWALVGAGCLGTLLVARKVAIAVADHRTLPTYRYNVAHAIDEYCEGVAAAALNSAPEGLLDVKLPDLRALLVAAARARCHEDHVAPLRRFALQVVGARVEHARRHSILGTQRELNLTKEFIDATGINAYLRREDAKWLAAARLRTQWRCCVSITGHMWALCRYAPGTVFSMYSLATAAHVLGHITLVWREAAQKGQHLTEGSAWADGNRLVGLSLLTTFISPFNSFLKDRLVQRYEAILSKEVHLRFARTDQAALDRNGIAFNSIRRQVQRCIDNTGHAVGVLVDRLARGTALAVLAACAVSNGYGGAVLLGATVFASREYLPFSRCRRGANRDNEEMVQQLLDKTFRAPARYGAQLLCQEATESGTPTPALNAVFAHSLNTCVVPELAEGCRSAALAHVALCRHHNMDGDADLVEYVVRNRCSTGVVNTGPLPAWTHKYLRADEVAIAEKTTTDAVSFYTLFNEEQHNTLRLCGLEMVETIRTLCKEEKENSASFATLVWKQVRNPWEGALQDLCHQFRTGIVSIIAAQVCPVGILPLFVVTRVVHHIDDQLDELFDRFSYGGPLWQTTAFLDELAALPVTIDLPSGARDVALRGDIAFRNVSLVYRAKGGTEHKALNNLSFDVAAGQMVGLVGPSGGGKSSIMKMLKRLYSPSEGEILLDGQPLAHYNTQWLRAAVAIVPQTCVIIPRTSIADNIRFGMEATDEEVVAAAKMAQCHDFIMKKRYKYKTKINGRALSGGQKQRIAIARALLRKPAVLLLDEATSALDVRSEKLIQKALSEFTRDRTCIVIAHRLATVRHADKLIVIEDGRCIQEGTYDALAETPGVFQNLVEKQNLLAQQADAGPRSPEHTATTKELRKLRKLVALCKDCGSGDI